MHITMILYLSLGTVGSRYLLHQKKGEDLKIILLLLRKSYGIRCTLVFDQLRNYFKK